MVYSHPFHLVSASPWPLLTSTSLLLVAFSLLVSLSAGFSWFFVLALSTLVLVLIFWFMNIILESTYSGSHTKAVQLSLIIGWLAFLASEVMFFSTFFWAFLHYGLSPDVALGRVWPPTGLKPLCPFHLPLLNTILLLTSSFTITWSHSALLRSEFSFAQLSLSLTLLLSMWFLFTQYFEYRTSSFTVADSCYGSIFFLATGFHGLHVFIGSLFLLVGFIRLLSGHFTSTRHLGFLFSIWYWHFVDVIWLFLFFVFYVWGS